MERQTPVGPRAVRRFVAARLDRESYLGLRLMAAVLLFACSLWLFGGLLEDVLDNAWLVARDQRIEDWFHTHATPTGLQLFSVLTQLGSPVVNVVIAIVGVVLWRRRERLLLWTWLVANLLGRVLESLLKLSVHRHRPQYAAAFLHGQSYSFPSGHAMESTICYGLLAALLVEIARPPRRRRILLYVCCAMLIGTIGFSRLYLGVHYPSDVLGGFAAGSAWTAACLSAYAVARHRQRGSQ